MRPRYNQNKIKNMKIALYDILKKNKNITYFLALVILIILFAAVLMLGQKKPRLIGIEKPQTGEQALEEAARLYNAPDNSENKVEVPKDVLDLYSSPSAANKDANNPGSKSDTDQAKVPKEILDSFSASSK